jgi:hypothetical protein
MLWSWPLAHISSKRIEVIAPLWANRNASAAVSLIPSMFWIFATLNHTFPDIEKRVAA